MRATNCLAWRRKARCCHRSAQTAWKNTTFVKDDAIVYLEPSFYLTEGIQAYTALFGQIEAAFTKA